MCLKIDKEFEIDRPHNSGMLYEYLMDYKFYSDISMLPFPLNGDSPKSRIQSPFTVLDVCCGSGMISEYYAINGAIVTGIDLSNDAINRANERKQKYGFKADFIVADATNLPFPDKSFDLVSVHDGLHHLKDPKKAVLEMSRVARKAIIIMEPSDAFITKIAVLFGLSKKYEEDDFIYRFKENELNKWLKESGVKKILAKRYLMYYKHKPDRIFRMFDNKLLFLFIKFIFKIMNIFVSRFGNKINVIGVK